MTTFLHFTTFKTILSKPIIFFNIHKRFGGGKKPPLSPIFYATDHCHVSANIQYFIPPFLEAKFKGNLFDYQKEKLTEMYSHYFTKQISFICAMDMGTGKTSLTLAFLIKVLNSKPPLDYPHNLTFLYTPIILIIAPKSVLVNTWPEEIEKFTENLRVHFYTTKDRLIKPCQIIITSYEMFLKDNEIFKSIKWELLILDEAHKIRNPKSVLFKTVNSLNAKQRIALTGTPIVNSLCDLMTLMNFIIPKFFDKKNFINYFLMSIEYNHNIVALNKLVELTKPFIILVLKEDVLSLPALILRDHMITLIGEDRLKYKKFYEPLGSLFKKGQPLKTTKRKKLDLLKRKSFKRDLFWELVDAKYLLNHPKQEYYADLLTSGKLDRMQNSNSLNSQTNKIEETVRIVTYHTIRGEKGLIFTQFTDTILVDALIEAGFKVLFFNGACTAKDRENLLKEFKTTNIDILIISLLAGGVGLNLTQASYVIHFDLWWNHAIEDQATQRAFRYGQTKEVNVYRFITKDTWEEDLNLIIQRKKKVTKEFLRVFKVTQFKPLSEIQGKHKCHVYFEQKIKQYKIMRKKKLKREKEKLKLKLIKL